MVALRAVYYSEYDTDTSFVSEWAWLVVQI